MAEGPEKASGRGRLGAAAQHALGFKPKAGGPSEFFEYRRLLRDIPIAMDVVLCRRIIGGISREAAIGALADAHGLSESTVARLRLADERRPSE